MSKKRILFLNLPTLTGGRFNRPIRFPAFGYATPVLHPPLLLAYAAAYIREKGYEVSFIDAVAEDIDVESLTRIVADKFQPDFIVAETSTPSFKNDVDVLDFIKRAYNCKIVLVGPHVSAIPYESLKSSRGVVDAVIVGEYEVSLLEYLEKGPDGTKGVGFIKDSTGEVIINERRLFIENLDALPFPARDLLPNHKYFDPILKNPFTFVLAGRGCPYKCIFCNWPQVLTGRKYRYRSPKNVVDELEHIEKKYDFKSFLFNDDTLTINKNFIISLCDEILERKIKIPWACYARADNDDEFMLKKLREAGCFLLKVGVESGDQQILNNIRKGYKIEKVERAIKLMKDLGFHVHATFVFGMPGESIQTIKKTINFAKKLKPTTVQFSTGVPYPGTEFYMYLKSNGYLHTEDWNLYTPLQPLYSYPELSADEIIKAVNMAYKSYYLNFNYIVTQGIGKFFEQPIRTTKSAIKVFRLAFSSTKKSP